MRALTDKLRRLVAKAPPPKPRPIYVGNADAKAGFVADPDGIIWLLDGQYQTDVAHPIAPIAMSLLIATYDNYYVKMPIRWQ